MSQNKQTERKNRILKDLEKAYEKMIEFKRRNNSEIVILKENKIIKTKP